MHYQSKDSNSAGPETLMSLRQSYSQSKSLKVQHSIVFVSKFLESLSVNLFSISDICQGLQSQRIQGLSPSTLGVDSCSQLPVYIGTPSHFIPCLGWHAIVLLVGNTSHYSQTKCARHTVSYALKMANNHT